MPLAMLRVGECKQVKALAGDLETKKRLTDLGFVEGEKVFVLGANPDGLILKVKGVRFALNRGLAQRITVY